MNEFGFDAKSNCPCLTNNEVPTAGEWIMKVIFMSHVIIHFYFGHAEYVIRGEGIVIPHSKMPFL